MTAPTVVHHERVETDTAVLCAPQIATRVAVDASGCWLWTGSLHSNGYPRLSGQWAHRLTFEMAYGSIPGGLHIDHLCRVPRCVRPTHLEAVTQAENNRRAFAARPAPTQCKWGHALADAYRYGNETVCRVCTAWRAECVRARRANLPLPDAASYRIPPSLSDDLPCSAGCGRRLKSPAGRAAHERRCTRQRITTSWTAT